MALISNILQIMLTAAIIFFAPGYILLRITGIRLNAAEATAFVIGTSIAASIIIGLILAYARIFTSWSFLICSIFLILVGITYLILFGRNTHEK